MVRPSQPLVADKFLLNLGQVLLTDLQSLERRWMSGLLEVFEALHSSFSQLQTVRSQFEVE